MGDFNNHTQRHFSRLFVFTLSLLAIIYFSGYQVSADSKVDSDLVFDNLDKTNEKSDDNHLRIANNLEDSNFPENEYWLLHTVGRIKRSKGEIFSKNEKPHSKKIEKSRKLRQTDLGQQEAEEDYDNEDDEGYSDDFSGNSGEGEFDLTTDIPTDDNHPVYYRLTLTVMEPYQDSYSNPNSKEFLNFTKTLGEDIDELYEPLPGKQSASVISIRRSSNDAFKIIVEVDIDSVGFSQEEGLKRVIREAIFNQHRIGHFTVNQEDFNFKKFVARECSTNEFQCKNRLCVPSYSRCNSVMDCEDNSDEENCPARECSTNEFQCKNGLCVPSYSRCDTKMDCEDNSDEENCPTVEIIESEFETNHDLGNDGSGDGDCRADDAVKCADNSRTICSDQVCDGHEDCPGGTDEQNCPTSKPDCNQGEFVCDMARCIPLEKQCDGVPDCSDGTDERACCTADQFKCDQTKCFPHNKKCDGIRDCDDETDEQDCSAQCPADQYSCGPYDRCIPQNRVCDGVPDCSNRRDEENCECSPNQIMCNDGSCVDGAVCNNIIDCPDYSDEANCSNCGLYLFTCNDKTCINESLICNKVRDCPDGSDEESCASCSAHEFLCDGICLLGQMRCDGVKDCRDGTDEENCPPPTPEPCPLDHFPCDGLCLPRSKVCDNLRDCPSGIDEEHCLRSCTEDEFNCGDSQCISKDKVCDNVPDCYNRNDETNCNCKFGEFRCRNGSCIRDSRKCDGRRDCQYGEDELNCTIRCQPQQQPCSNGEQCIYPQQVCDGKADCDDFSDERNCGTGDTGMDLKTYPSAQEISENREVVFQCRDEGSTRARVKWTRENGRPLPPGSVDRNGRLEIPDIKLEHSGTYTCQAIGYPPGTRGASVNVFLKVDRLAPPTLPPRSDCQPHEATCGNGQCIEKKFVCDGKYDCHDGSDEIRCNRCEPNEFTCANKKCIIKTWLCDGQDDCGDNSDEANCEPTPPGALCQYHQFTCLSQNQCISRSFQCDMTRDCADGSDEVGCAKPVISQPPPSMITLSVSETFTVTCTAVGIPTPEINWRLNWGHIPSKCQIINNNGHSTLTCPDIQIEDQGAYSCEAINYKGIVFAQPDTILVVKQDSVCRPGYFNVQATTETECIKCFCFGHTSSCKSADLYIYQLQPPFHSLKAVGVRIAGGIEVRDEPIYQGAQPQLNQVGRNGVHVTLSQYGEIAQNNLYPYFAMPENHHGHQLNSYGGYLKYKVYHSSKGYPTSGPDIIITGNGYTLLHTAQTSPPAYTETNMEVRFFDGEWTKQIENGRELPASREEIMMTLANIDNILIKLQYNDGLLNTTLRNIEMDSAGAPNYGLGVASYVESCSCPAGYSGLSCEKCADGYVRSKTGPWLGHCIEISHPQECAPGEFGDPANNIPCEPCPCPYTNPSQQFARTCSLHSDGGVICHCDPGYEGRRCEKCSVGYTGNPMRAGGNCRRIDYPQPQCGPGAIQSADGNCQCKLYTHGPSCSECKANTFHLSAVNQYGCIPCFCMGVTNECSSSVWFRERIFSVFGRSTNDFQLVNTYDRKNPITNLLVRSESRELAYNAFQSSGTYYWSLPSRYLGDKVYSYGGKLRYTLRVTPLPGGQSSRNSAADVELVSSNNINLLYFSRDQPTPSNQTQSFEVPLLEQYWQRQDGQKADREHLLMTLATLSAIYIKATYYTSTSEASLIDVSLDIASERNTGLERALEVEQCRCPVGYRGLSCEHCDVGYTRSDDRGIYLGLCEPCECNGNSNECDPVTGICINCRNNTAGDFCDVCLDGYEGDALVGRCSPIYNNNNNNDCRCDHRGSVSSDCYYGSCRCKSNVEGRSCDTCRPGTFGLSANKTYGCDPCFCFGVSRECTESNLFIEQIPSQIFDNTHGFTLINQNNQDRRTSNFELDVSVNKIGYHFSPSERGTWYWSLPGVFTGNQIKSFGGKIEFMQTYRSRPGATYYPDKDIIINGHGISIYWNNPSTPVENRNHFVSVTLRPEAGWTRIDQSGPKPASREDMLTVLSGINSILIRASLSSATEAAYLSDLVMDTAVNQQTTNGMASNVETCRCPEGYQGTSCESCAPGYYRDTMEQRPLGSCKRCPCNGNEQSCNLSPDGRVECHCKHGFEGYNCYPSGPTTPGPVINNGTGSPPTITITIATPEIEIYEVGSTVRYNCSAISLQSPRTVRVTWSKDNGLPDRAIDDGRGVLIITNLRETDSGNYICQAYDGYNVGTKQVSLVVGETSEKPPHTAVTGHAHVRKGQPIHVNCVSSGYPIPNMRIERIDRTPISRNYVFEHGEFTIPEAQKSDEGLYRCVGENRAGSSIAEFQVVVEDIPGTIMRVNIEPPFFDGKRGDTVILTCRSEISSQNIRWQKQNGQLPYHAREDRDQLIIPNAQPEDSGVYICSVTTYTGTGQTTASVTIRNTETLGQYPTATVVPERNTINQGETLELHCQANGIPTPTVKWTKVGSDLGSHIQQLGSTLYIKDARVEDRGVYVCVSKNDLGLSQAYSTVEVNRREIPSVTIFPDSNRVITAGSSDSIQCRILTGIPTPQISWSRPNGEPLGTNVEQMAGGTLRFTQVSIQDQGQYICTATNIAGTTSAVASITVQTLPEIQVYPSELIILSINEPLKLQCAASGVPKPSAIWTRDSSSQLRGSLNRNLNDGVAVMEFNSISKADEGIYYCIAENAAGQTQKQVRVVVDELPKRGDIVGSDDEDPTRGPSLKNINHEYGPPQRTYDEKITAPVGTRAELTCRVQNRLEPVNVNWIRVDNSSLPPNAFARQETLYIESVQPSAAGEYKCVGIDTYTGRIAFTLSTYLEVISPPKISLNPERQVVRPGQDATIQCTAIGEKPIEIYWTAMNRTMPTSVTTRDGFIQFSRIQLNDAGRYRCTARNNAGEADAVADVLVEDVIRNPVITAENKMIDAPVGSVATLRCKTLNNENVRWYREQLPLPRNAAIRGNILALNNVQPDNEGRYYCEAYSDAGVTSDYTDVRVSRPTVVNTPQVLYITPSREEYRAGENVQLTCQSTEPGVILVWTKVDGWLPENANADRGVLRIHDLNKSNAGHYRCEATGGAGLYYKDQYINVIDDFKDEPVIETKTAARGSTVLLTCNTDLPGPITYLWSKQNGLLPDELDIFNKSITLNDVSGADAGTYSCLANSGVKSIEVPFRLTVTGLVPYFTQSPLSYIALQTLPESYVQFVFEISFKPENGHGIILYNGQKGNDPSGDFISLALVQSVPEFKFNLGHSTTTVRGNSPLNNQQWHTIKIIRNRRTVSMYVDGDGPFTGSAEGNPIGLELKEHLYLGGVPSSNAISPDVAVNSGMVGCISLFKIGQAHVDILKEAIDKVGITSCETCAENKCENQGMCQENLSKEGYVCLCSADYSGATCNKPKGEACSPGTCGPGRCVDTENSFECLCPLGYAGQLCEREIKVIEPAFSNNAYIAYPPTKTSRRIKITMKIKPRTVDDGLLLYAAETEEGYGEFMSLAIRDRHLEFRFDAGNGPVVIQQREEIEPNKWSVLTASRNSIEGRLVINGAAPVNRRFTNRKVLNLMTPIYVGGYDKTRITLNEGVKVDKGFNGCVSQINIAGIDMDITHSANDSANVEQCSEDDDFDNNLYSPHTSNRFDSGQTGCSHNPCVHGECYPLSPTTYQCSCHPGFTGINCELPLNAHPCEKSPCKNGATCRETSSSYTCDCSLGYTGMNCDQRTELRNDVHFDGTGYLEFSRDLLEKDSEKEQVIAFELSTNHSDGLIFWHGQKPNEDGQGQDYVSLAIVNGYLEYSYDLGSGPAIIRNGKIKVDDGQRHSVILKRNDKSGSIEIDNTYLEQGESEGFTSTLNAAGNIYLGGTPNIPLMTSNRLTKGFNGCIHGFELQESKTLDLGVKAINGVNAKPCSSFEKSIWENELVN